MLAAGMPAAAPQRCISSRGTVQAKHRTIFYRREKGALVGKAKKIRHLCQGNPGLGQIVLRHIATRRVEQFEERGAFGVQTSRESAIAEIERARDLIATRFAIGQSAEDFLPDFRAHARPIKGLQPLLNKLIVNARKARIISGQPRVNVIA